VLAHHDNVAALMAMPGAWVDRVRQRRPMKILTFDLDSSVSETYGHQEGSSCRWHFGCQCDHPLFCFSQFGEVERALLRDVFIVTNVHWSARRMVNFSNGSAGPSGGSR